MESLLLAMLGESERKERVWDSGSDHSAELPELDSTLTDLVGQLGTGPFKAGIPQRVKLDERIAELAARQEELSKAETKAAGWTWQPTGELFSQWWERQTTEQRNIRLRTMGVELPWTFEDDAKDPNVDLNLGDLETLTEQLRPEGSVQRWQEVLSQMERGSGAVIENGAVSVLDLPASRPPASNCGWQPYALPLGRLLAIF